MFNVQNAPNRYYIEYIQDDRNMRLRDWRIHFTLLKRNEPKQK